MKFILNLTSQNAELWKERYGGMVMNYVLRGGIWLWFIGRTYSAVSLGQGWRTYSAGAQNCTRKTSLARGIQCSPIFFLFLLPDRRLYIVTNVCVRACVCVCVYTHIPDCVQTVYDLPSLPNDTASETFFTQTGRNTKCWFDIYLWGAGLCGGWANTWHWAKGFKVFFRNREH